MFVLDLASVISIVVYVFLLIIVGGIISFLILNENSDKSKSLQKVIGGLAIFILAIIANNSWVYSLSVFVGGLIIASEDFMKFFAAIMRTSGDKVAETVNALNTKKATAVEVDDKVKTEVKEVDTQLFVDDDQSPSLPDLEIVPSDSQTLTFGANESVNERLRKLRLIESQIHPFLIEKLGPGYENNMKLTRGDRSLVVDGILKERGKIKNIVEIKYISEKSFDTLRFLIIRLREKIARIGVAPRLILVIVSDTMNIESALKMKEDNKGLAKLLFFKFNQEKSNVDSILVD